MRDWLGTNPLPPPPSTSPGPAADRQGLAGVLACHVLHSHSEVAHGALAAAEVEAVWVHEQQAPAGAGAWPRQRDREPGGQWPPHRDTEGWVRDSDGQQAGDVESRVGNRWVPFRAQMGEQ